MNTATREGLENVVVTSSGICFIDGQRGIIHYRGIDIGDLARYSTYEETVYLLWFGELPTSTELDAFRAELTAERELDEAIWSTLTSLPGRPRPMEALRTMVSALSCCDPHINNHTPEGNINKAIRLTAKIPTIAAYYHRYLEGLERVHPDPSLGHAANFLYMWRGEAPTALEERAMDVAMMMMADHELNASTFAARVTASTLSDIYSAVTAAIGTLKGPLHGAANQKAMEMLLEIGDVDNVEPYITAALAAKKRIMGFGHRVYRNTMDPRSVYLRKMLRELCTQSGDGHLYHLAIAVSETVWEKKRLFPNVDFFAAPLLHTLGIPVDLFTPVFATSRVAGWTAHVMEQYENNRLLRPLSNYVGSAHRPYVPLEERFPKASAPDGYDAPQAVMAYAGGRDL
jgi:citrate synthase